VALLIYTKNNHTVPVNYQSISSTITFRILYEKCLQPVLFPKMSTLDVAQDDFPSSHSSVDQTFNYVALQ
jgi:hypothetical protein